MVRHSSYAHNEDLLNEVTGLVVVPADHYVMVDDKPRVLSEVKTRLGSRVATIHVYQGKYAHLGEHDPDPDADRAIDDIAAFTEFEPGDDS